MPDKLPLRRAYLLKLVALLMAMAMVAAACGGDDSGGDGENAGEDDGGAQESEDLDEGEPQPGGELVYALEAETNGGFCLQEAQLAISGIQVTRTIYDTLTAPNEDGEIEPFLAESVEPNDDFTEWTITLREGITFHDGTPVDAEIVADNLNAYRGAYKDAAGNNIRSPALFIFVFQDVQDVQATGPLEVKVTTKRPWVSFDWFLWGSSRVGIMGRSQLDAPQADCANKLNGTGPFKLERWVVNQQLVAAKNENYWQTDEAGNKLPYLDRVIYRPIAEDAQMMNALESGQINALHTSSTEQMAERLRPLSESGDIELRESDAFGEVNYVMLNSSKPPFDNKNARIAAAAALDKELLIEVRGGGIGEPATGPFAEDVLGYVEDTGYPEYDVEAAKEAAAAYQQETGQPLTFTYSYVTGEADTLTAQELQTQWGEAGIRVDIAPTGDQATHINRALAGDFQAIAWRNHPGADPDTQYNWWYEGSPVNFGRITDPEINRLLDEGRTNPEGREEIYQQLNKRFGSEVYNIWTSRAIWAVANAPEVNGLFDWTLPSGSGDNDGLGTGHQVTAAWIGE
ncbi:MAG: ABC transporter substrate-binding protein [Actinomycetota bacterium]